MQSNVLAGVTAAVQRAANYRGKPFPQTHPDRLATLARLHGLDAKLPNGCRVLELGCGDGGNLIPMAFELSGSEFVGIDLAADRVEVGAAWARHLGLGNVRLEARDISDIGDEYGKFDYIVAHGVYCWVPAPVRDRLFEACRALLEPTGVAYVSFNTKPGWHFLEYLRDFALLSARQGESAPPDVLLKNIRGLAQLYAQELPSEGGLALHLKELYTRLSKTSDYLLAFDYLGEISEPIGLVDFVQHAERFDLRYLIDANYYETEWRNLPKRARTALSGLSQDAIAREAFADCFTGRLFRRALLCHRAATLRAPEPSDVKKLQILGNAKRLEAKQADSLDGPASYEMLHGARITVTAPVVKLALARLAEAWPGSVRFGQLHDSVAKGLPGGGGGAQLEPTLAGAVWEMYCLGALDLRQLPPDCVADPGERPYASALARSQLSFGDAVTNQHHDFTRLLDPVSLELFKRLDGQRTRAELTQELRELAHAGKLAGASPSASQAELAAAVDERLTAWAKHALLSEPRRQSAAQKSKGDLGGSRPS